MVSKLETREHVYFRYGVPTRRLMITAGLTVAVIAVAVIAAIVIGRAIIYRSADPVDGRYSGWYSIVRDDEGTMIANFRTELTVHDGKLTTAAVWVEYNNVYRREFITFSPPLAVENGRFEFHGAATVEGRFYGNGRQVKGTWTAGSLTEPWEARWVEDADG